MSEIGTFTRGNGLQKKDFTEEGYPCVHYGQIHTKFNSYAYKAITNCSFKLARKLKKAKKGDIILATTSENSEDVCKAVVWLGKEVAVSGDAYIFSHNQYPNYIGHLFRTSDFLKYKKRYAIGTKVIRISGEKIGEYEIPIPSLSEQKRIADILDRFESLTTDLQEGLPAEINARRQQYEYYRDKLLTFKRKSA